MDNPFIGMTANEVRDRFLGLNNAQELASFLSITSKQLGYFSSEGIKEKHYVSFKLRKKRGGFRTIEAPSDALKTIQRKLAFTISEIYHPLSCVSGFVSKRGLRYGASKHEHRKKLVNFDLENFFPSIPQNKVFGVFAQYFNLPIAVSDVLAKLVCLHHCLTQGSPTSPCLSNIILHKLDSQMLRIAKRTGTTYTRYVDDITFSSRGNMPKVIWHHDDISNELKQIINAAGFRVNSEKT
ncbi:RNA-directed DNA polymerase [Lacticaseibacillus zeae]|uniref:reverse transcriptase family protein n=1 Tax=Lacticaseibacillus zeae TaxID=57037 RepID=UPI001BCBFFFD|nr:reverse transcriptase family protein [Lacticaseibacillus zeae]QVI33270.1 RNA-directed DNA polymerase [Lacticaseibacillus zeae]